MFKIPKQGYIAEFKELAAKRVGSGQGITAVARELRLIEPTLAYDKQLDRIMPTSEPAAAAA